MSAQATTTMSVETSAIAQILRALFPPSLLVHVGWGNGLGDLTQWTAWQVPQALVIESEESKLAACQAQALALAQANGQTNPSWQTLHATLAAQGGEQPYHVASNPSESGLLPAASLQHAWPHLQTVASPTVVARSLDELWQDVSLPLPIAASSQSTWLIIDCLPAADILAGGVAVLQSAQVVCARSLLANRALLCDQMRAAGWIEVSWAESQHPAFGHAWFSRDTGLLLESAAKRQKQLATERDEQQRTAEQAFVVIESLTQQRDLYLSQRDEVNHVRVEQQAQLDAFEKAIAESQAQLGISSQAQVALQSEIESLTQQRDLYLTQRDEFNHVRVEQQAQLDVLSQEIQSVKAEKNNLHDMHQDLIVRIRLMEDEISRTEGQIELIKDLMLSEGRTT